MLALITGAEKGLGKAILNNLEDKGIDCVNVPRYIFTEQNIYEDLKSFLFDEKIIYKKVDFVINCFGINHLSWIGETPKSDSDIMMINTMGPYWMINHLVNLGQTCRVVNVSSLTYRVPQRCSTIYCASKAALVQMTKVMARELAPKGWVINAFAPGKILGTEMTSLVEKQVLELRGWTAEQAAEYEHSTVPMSRFMTVYEAANIAVGVLNGPDYINGEVIAATGGY